MENPNIIIRLPTENRDEVNALAKEFRSSQSIIIPESAKILIKDGNGLWREVGKKKIKIGELEVED